MSKSTLEFMARLSNRFWRGETKPRKISEVYRPGGTEGFWLSQLVCLTSGTVDHVFRKQEIDTVLNKI